MDEGEQVTAWPTGVGGDDTHDRIDSYGCIDSVPACGDDVDASLGSEIVW
jgi:hypothetical protein